jgi:uncharacterized protein YegL
VTEVLVPVLPVYLVCQEFGSPDGIEAINESIVRLRDEIAAQPDATEGSALCLLAFSREPEVLLPLADARQLGSVPKLAPGKASNYGAALDLLYETITRDVEALRSIGCQVRRPIVFLIVDSEPDDDWTKAYWRLIRRADPHIVSFGLGGVSQQTLKRVATVRAFAASGEFTGKSQPARVAMEGLAGWIAQWAVNQDDSLAMMSAFKLPGFAALPWTESESIPRAHHSQGYPVSWTEPPPDPQPQPTADRTLRTFRDIWMNAASGGSVLDLAPETRDRLADVKFTADSASPDPDRGTPDPLAGQDPGSVAGFEPGRPGGGTAEVDGIPSPKLAEAVKETADPLTVDPPSLNGLPGHWHKAADTELDGADLAGLSVRAASLRGAAHRESGVSRTDAMDIYQVANGGIDAIVATVVGRAADDDADEPDGDEPSESPSGLAAREAARLIREEVRVRLPHLFAAQPGPALDTVCADLLATVAERLTRRAGFLGIDTESMSVVLATVVVQTAAEGTSRPFVSFTLGDCAIFMLHGGDFLPAAAFCFALPEGTPLSDDQPFAGQGPDAADRIDTIDGLDTVVSELDLGHMLIACTGSLAESLSILPPTEASAQLAAAWGTGQPPDLLDFAAQLSHDWSGATDDRTAVCLWAR